MAGIVYVRTTSWMVSDPPGCCIGKLSSRALQGRSSVLYSRALAGRPTILKPREFEFHPRGGQNIPLRFASSRREIFCPKFQ